MEKIIVGKYDKSVKGKKAKLTQEIQFTSSLHRDKRHKRVFPAGTIVEAVHEVMGTGLTTFKFFVGSLELEHVVREGKYEYIA